jgi:hypothetical protein
VTIASGAAITMRYKAVAEKLQKDKKFKSQINRLKSQIVNN